MVDYTPKDILDKYASQVATKDAIWINEAGKPQINATKSFLYSPQKYSEDIRLWKAPNDWIRLEFDGITADEARSLISEVTSNLKRLQVQFCITHHEGGVSPYINICNIKGIPLTNSKEAKDIWVSMFVPPKFLPKVDDGNFGFKFTPAIGFPHWKPKYNGAIHQIVAGVHPLEQTNELPKEVLKIMNKNKKKALQDIEKTPFVDKWTTDFLINYCCNNILPDGTRHNVITKNLGILLAWNNDRDAIIEKYCATQKIEPTKVLGWIRSAVAGTLTKVSAGELARYIKENNIAYTIPLQKEETEIKTPLSVIDKVSQLMLHKPARKDEATTIVADYILSKEHIKTTRSDIQQETWIYRDGIYIPDGCTVIKEWCDKMFRQAYSPQIANTVIAKIQVKTYVDSKEFLQTNYPDKICCINGVLTLSTRELVDHTPDLIFFNKIPVQYNPAMKCETWNKHLDTVLTVKEDKDVLQEWFGFCLYKDYKYEKAMLLNGSGRNGKGKTLEVLKRLLGAENCSGIELQELTNYNFSREGIVNKLANICGDISATAIKETGKFKMLTGHDQMEIYRKFQKSLPYTSYAKLVFSCNEVPATPDNTKAFFDRWLIIDFPFTFVSQQEYDLTSYDRKAKWKIRDPGIINKLTTPEELSGILNWALDGLDRLHANKSFSTSATMESIRVTWLMKSDSVASFCIKHISKDFDNELRHDEIKSLYLKFCDDNNIKTKPDKYFRDYIQNNYPAELKDKKSRIGDKGNEDAVYDRWLSWKGIKYVENKARDGNRFISDY